jgi:plasmid stability protein
MIASKAKAEVLMAQILVRNLKEATVNRLKARARKKGWSLQTEVKEIIEQSARMELDAEAAWKRAAAIRENIAKRIGGRLDDSTLIIRKERDWRTRRLEQSE